MSEYSQILVEQADAVLTITLNRPEKLNAYTPVMMGELISAVTAAMSSPIITGVYAFSFSGRLRVIRRTASTCSTRICWYSLIA